MNSFRNMFTKRSILIHFLPNKEYCSIQDFYCFVFYHNSPLIPRSSRSPFHFNSHFCGLHIKYKCLLRTSTFLKCFMKSSAMWPPIHPKHFPPNLNHKSHVLDSLPSSRRIWYSPVLHTNKIPHTNQILPISLKFHSTTNEGSYFYKIFYHGQNTCSTNPIFFKSLTFPCCYLAATPSHRSSTLNSKITSIVLIRKTCNNWLFCVGLQATCSVRYLHSNFGVYIRDLFGTKWKLFSFSCCSQSFLWLSSSTTLSIPP